VLKPRGFEHIGIVVSDMDRSLRFYVEGLGLDLLRRREGFAALRVGAAEINMFGNPNRPAAESDAAQRVDHVCFCMDSPTIDDLIAALRDTRIAIDSGPVRRSDGVAVFVRDPDGIRVELLVKTAGP